jgi:hypothetical protein
MCASAILARDDRVVAGHVRLRVVAAVLVLHIDAGTELLEVEAAPVDADLVTDAAGFLDARTTGLTHRVRTSLVAGTASVCSLRRSFA